MMWRNRVVMGALALSESFPRPLHLLWRTSVANDFKHPHLANPQFHLRTAVKNIEGNSVFALNSPVIVLRVSLIVTK